MEIDVASKHWYFTKLHGVTHQKTVIFKFIFICGKSVTRILRIDCWNVMIKPTGAGDCGAGAVVY
jgi:hypothetical protein